MTEIMLKYPTFWGDFFMFSSSKKNLVVSALKKLLDMKVKKYISLRFKNKQINKIGYHSRFESE